MWDGGGGIGGRCFPATPKGTLTFDFDPLAEVGVIMMKDFLKEIETCSCPLSKHGRCYRLSFCRKMNYKNFL